MGRSEGPACNEVERRAFATPTSRSTGVVFVKGPMSVLRLQDGLNRIPGKGVHVGVLVLSFSHQKPDISHGQGGAFTDVQETQAKAKGCRQAVRPRD